MKLLVVPLIVLMTTTQLVTEKMGKTQVVTWTAPTVNTDGTPLTDLGGFVIAVVGEGKDMNVPGTVAITEIHVTDPAATRWEGSLPGMVDGSIYEVWVASKDTSGNKSGWAGPVTRMYDAKVPAMPENVDVK